MRQLLLITGIATFLTLFFTNNIQAQKQQGFCGFEQVRDKMEHKSPKLKGLREQAEQKYKSTMLFSSRKTKSGHWTGQIYEIPIVIHVIENRTGNGKTGKDDGSQLTDDEIKTWIENTNKMYASTYQSVNFPDMSSFFPVGTGADKGTVMPFKLVLAKRNPNCQATTGIIRYDAGNMPNGKGTAYAEHGVNMNNTEGVAEGDILDFVPHWSEKSYYNIYLITGFDDNFGNGGIMGYATYCTVPAQQYHSFMKVVCPTVDDSNTLAHEFGHALGLMHTFEGADEQGQSCPNATNDEVADTEIAKSMLTTYPLPTNNDINGCTGKNYQGVQYNVMNYTSSVKKFTPGQRDRALQMFLNDEKGKALVKSNGAKPITTTISVTASTCTIIGIDNTNSQNDAGAVKTIFGTIDNATFGNTKFGGNARQFYIDYTAQWCYNSTIQTEIPQNTATPLKISNESPAKQDIKAWIDYNDNGTFEASEQVFYKQNAEEYGGQTYTENITPPANAVTGKFLRMRVIGDIGNANIQPCGKLKEGQAQDYLVKIKASNSPQITLTATLKNITKVYDGNTTVTVSVNDFTITGKQGSDDVSLDLANITADYDNKNVGTNKTVTVTGLKLQGSDASKYQLQNTSLNGTVGEITKKNINVVADAKSKNKGDADPVLTYTVNPALFANDSFSGKLEREKGEAVGNYKILQGTLSAGNNYAINFTGAKFTISQQTGIEENHANNVRIYPTIVDTYFIIETSSIYKTLYIYSITGEQIRNVQLTPNQNQVVEVSTLKSGIYIAKLGTYVFKFIKK